MKYWRGYLTAAIFAAFTWILSQIAQKYPNVMDMIYPYVTRSLQTGLADYSSSVSFVLWQTLAMAALVIVAVTVVLMVILKWNPIQWFGWIVAAASIVFFLHTALYGLNTYAGPLYQDLHMKNEEYTLSQMEEATAYYRDQANALALQIPRDSDGKPDYPEFEALAESCKDGFHVLVYEKFYPVFAGSMQPVKKLGWAEMYTSMGITGVTMGITGEAAVNPMTPAISLPFTMCHEMAHRMCIAVERDANFAAYLACDSHSDVTFRYSANFMALQYLLSDLSRRDAEAAARIRLGINSRLKQDLNDYAEFFDDHRNETATKVANTANDTYIKVSGDDDGLKSYDNVSDLLVNWYNQMIRQADEPVDTAPKFDPYDPAVLTTPPTEPEETTAPTEDNG